MNDKVIMSIDETMKVDFFIAGAPKCGTSSLFSYLGQHPGIYVPKLKEPNFFNTDHKGAKPIGSMMEYHNLYKNENQKLTCDASPFYLYSLKAPKNIYDYNPAAKLIFMLRNPIDMLYSLHGQYLIDGNVEVIEDFIEALNAEDDRREGKRVPRYCNRPEGLFYSEYAKYTQYLKNYYAVFPKEQIKVIIFDDFIENIGKIYSDVLNFLELEEFTPVFKRMNQHEEPKYKALHRLNLYLRHAPVIGAIQKKFTLNTGLIRKINALNRMPAKRAPLQPETYNQLLDRFQSDIIELQDYLNIDLSFWLKRKETSKKKQP